MPATGVRPPCFTFVAVRAMAPVELISYREQEGEHVAKTLEGGDVTDQQRGQVERILRDYHTRAQLLKEQLELLRSEKEEKITAVLMPEQQAKFEKSKEATCG